MQAFRNTVMACQIQCVSFLCKYVINVTKKRQRRSMMWHIAGIQEKKVARQEQDKELQKGWPSCRMYKKDE